MVLVYPISNAPYKGTRVKLRLLSRIYMGFTALFYSLVGIAFTSGSLRLSDSEFTPHIFWSCAFVLTSVLAGFGWFSSSYKTAQLALSVCSAVAFGFAINFLGHLVSGDSDFLLGTGVWLYVGYSNMVIARLPDPYLLSRLDDETTKLKSHLGSVRNGE